MEEGAKINYLRDKPAFIIAIIICIGVTIANLFPQIIFWIGATVILLFLLLINIIFTKNKLFTSLLLLFLLISGAGTRHSLEKSYFSVNHISNYLQLNREVKIIGEIINDPVEKKYNYSYLVNIKKIIIETDTLLVGGNSVLTLQKKSFQKNKNINYGDVISIECLLEEPSRSRNPGEFSYRDYLSMHDVYGIITPVNNIIEVIEIGSPNIIFEKIIIPSRKFIKNVINFTMSSEESFVMKGLLLGDQAMISPEIKSSFINTGTIHVLAVSGSHIALIISVLYLLFGMIRIPFKIKISVTILGIIFYMLLTGSTPSVVRASIMGIVVLTSQLLDRKTNLYNTLGVSALIILIWDTRQLFDAGFQLSYSAVFSMVFFYPRIKLFMENRIPKSLNKRKFTKQLILLFGITLAAQIGTIPITAGYFEKISIISLVANLVVVPLIAFVMTIGLISVITSSISFWIGSFFMEVSKYILSFIIYFVDLMNQVPFGIIQTSTFTFWSFSYYLIIILFFLSLNKIQRLRKIFLLLFGIITLNLWFSNFQLLNKNNNLRITILDIGQGEAILIQTSENKNILIDAGTTTRNNNSGEKIITPFISRSEISKIDYFIITHPHSDHIGGASNILNSIKVLNVLDSGQPYSSKIYKEFDSMISKNKINRIILSRGDVIEIENNLRLYVLHPTKYFIDIDSSDGFTELNNSSVILKLVYGQSSILLTGDAEIESEDEIVNQYGDFLNTDILKAGHHGSKTSTSENLLKYVTPEYATISVGKFNKFHHPSPIILDRLKSYNSKIFRTDKDGAIIFESNGVKFEQIKW
ncbi:MAG: DNA internalization-related competence protein ComEC/Rec2 [Bacteroidetes bacterium]|nr:DNA internalization-related competence protein ComEC/Rec2 [Bacteroidota bacterium]